MDEENMEELDNVIVLNNEDGEEVKFEFLHELIGAKTEDILHDKDANSLN